ncbi:MAG: NosD domain-containing protein [Candidatus Bathyarchaeota archaeon]
MSKKEQQRNIAILVSTIFLLCLIVFNLQEANGSKTLIVPDNYLSINEAIKNATPGDIIFVKSGIYNENLIVNKSLKLIGENSRNTMIIGKGDIESGEQTVVTLNAEKIEITGFTIKSQNYSKSSLHATGICVEANNCKIKNNIICDTYYGIFCSVQSNITISKNQIISNLKDGIRFVGGSFNNISENNIEGNAKGGIAIEGYSNKISKNNITNNNRGIGMGSSYSLVFGNNIRNNIEFNFFFAGSYNIVSSNDISDSTWGIYFSPYFATPNQNKFYHNNFFNNLEHIGGTSSYNIQHWDAGFPAGGNYWDNYLSRYPESKEIEDSKIGNIQYEIDSNNTDNNPLIVPFNILSEEMLSLNSPPKVKQNSMVAYWSFDEVQPNGVTPDKTGLNSAVVGTSSGNYSFTPILIDGKFNKSLSFDGAAYVSTPILPNLEIPDEATIDVWINAKQFKNVKYNNIIVECARTRTQSPQRTFGLAINGLTINENPRIPQGAILAYVSTKEEGLNEIATESTINLNEWTHVVFTRSLSSGMHIYVNGKKQNVTLISGVQNPKGSLERETELYIGHDAVCLIDELRLYNIAIEPKNSQYPWIEYILILSILSGIGLFFYFKVKH